MEIKRTRWVVVTNDMKKILCGKPRLPEFRDINHIGDIIIRTYSTENKAYSALERANFHVPKPVLVMEVTEQIQIG